MWGELFYLLFLHTLCFVVCQGVSCLICCAAFFCGIVWVLEFARISVSVRFLYDYETYYYYYINEINFLISIMGEKHIVTTY